VTSKDKINGLVLAGGKSTRMGTDKTVMQWHGKEQRYYMADVLNEFCEDVYISCREEQASKLDEHYKALPDVFTNMGPYGGILTALQLQPERAWLVVASDLPLLDTDTISFLVAHRDASKMATAFISPHDGLPEPLIAIWEPRSFDVLMQYKDEGYKCPRKVLIKNEHDVQLLQAPNPDALMNTNTPEDAAAAKKLIH
jgi:molybdopterin-guanine dinucleotide biosynthesis protein A